LNKSVALAIQKLFYANHGNPVILVILEQALVVTSGIAGFNVEVGGFMDSPFGGAD